jgi:hypothetical protein
MVTKAKTMALVELYSADGTVRCKTHAIRTNPAPQNLSTILASFMGKLQIQRLIIMANVADAAILYAETRSK